MIVIFMEHYGYTLQEAVDHVGEMCRETIQTFVENQKRIPSFGDEKLDKDVAGYVEGLQNWIVGSLHWSFMTKRYFGTEGAEVKKHRWVKLLPKKDAGKTIEDPIRSSMKVTFNEKTSAAVAVHTVIPVQV